MPKIPCHEQDVTPQEVVVLEAQSARTAGDPVYVDADSGGLVDLSLADDTSVHHLVVAAHDIASGAKGQYVRKGRCVMTVASANYTAGHALKVLDGAVASTGAGVAATGVNGEASNELGVIIVGGTAVTSITVDLFGTPFTATT